jgi:hypothetical protein
MRKIIFATVIAAFSLQLNAQDVNTTESDDFDPADKMFIWSIGIEPSVPVGNFNKHSGFGLGGSVQGECKPTRMLGITVNAGYLNYFGTTADGTSYDDFQYWPVMGGVKLYMGEMAYIHGQAGVGFGMEDLGNDFWYGGGVGLNLTKAFDVEVKYTGWDQNEVGNGEIGSNGYNGYGGHYSTIGLRLAYSF